MSLPKRPSGALGLTAFLVAASAIAASIVTGEAAERAHAVRLAPSRAVVPGLAALPRLVVARSDRAAKRINRALAQSDAQVRDLAQSCRADAGAGKSGWTRSVAVTMRGPRYLSMVATDAWYCGGAYPDAETVPYVFDLRTGATVDWARLLPATMMRSAGSAGPSATQTASNQDGTVTSDVLADLYRKSGKPEAVNPQCKEAIAESSLSFLIWPDAKQDGLVIQPSGLPHVIAACAAPFVIPTATLRQLGVDSGLLDAVDFAHHR